MPTEVTCPLNESRLCSLTLCAAAQAQSKIKILEKVRASLTLLYSHSH
jgi:hypothetical protein